MSESESEENFCYFGKPLEPYDEDAFPKKRPISIEDQIATDAQGRRRFHGAFTGGFSAGFFNTVGSLEGWTPSEFKSTRAEKAKNVSQKPQDFMDEEDVGDYGIAPQTVKATNEFSTAKKRSRLAFSDGPIPGEPVLETLLTSGNETVGYLLLKNIGIQGKIDKQQEEIGASDTKVYGCQMPVQYKISESIENVQYQIPTIYQNSLQKPKSNTFGLGYQGLQNMHVNLFKPSKLVVSSKNKKLSIGGQAFGVGAFEEEDADIYMNDDMSNYDFEMTKEKNVGESKYDNCKDLLFGMFKKSKSTLIFKKLYPPPTIPHSFTGKHKLRKSRFEPVEEKQGETHESGQINPAIRAKYLGENSEKTYTTSKSILPHSKNTGDCNQEVKIEKDDSSNKPIDITSIFMSDKFVSATEKEDVSNILENVKRSETLHGTEQMREAARMKMFGPLTRVTVTWNPYAILCKRFNVPEPLAEKPESRSKKRQKNLIFENQKYNEDNNLFKSGICDDTTSEMNQKDEVTTITETVDQYHFTDKTGQMKDTIPEKQQIGVVEEELKKEPESFAQDSTEKIGVADKIDLFKAVFCSSSSDDSEDEGNNSSQTVEIDKTEQFRSSLAEPLLPKLKPLKQGILSNVSFGVFSEPKNEFHDVKMLSEVDKSEIKSTDFKSKTDPFLYGPEVPNEKVAISGSSKNNLALVLSSSEDEWVEIEKKNKKKKGKHKKKRKKEKHKKRRNERE